MGSPYNLSSAAISLFFSQTRASAEYKAISLITESLAHPQRTLLSAFILQAIDREVASQFFLNEVSGKDGVAVLEFPTDWKSLLTKGTPLINNQKYILTKTIIIFGRTSKFANPPTVRPVACSSIEQ